MTASTQGLLVFFFGPAGAGKSTLAKEWCKTRTRAVHIELDEVRSLIVSGLADPQSGSSLVGDQYKTAVEACCALARAFVDAGYDVTVDDAASATDFTTFWQPNLNGLTWKIVVVRPELATVLSRNAQRQKTVRPEIIEWQHREATSWPAALTIDTTGLSLAESLQLVTLTLATQS